VLPLACLTSKLRSSTSPVVVVSQYISKADSTASFFNIPNAIPKLDLFVVSSLPIFFAVLSLAIYGFASLIIKSYIL